MNKKAEAYTILMEECGELIQACSKMIRTKGSAVYRKQLQDEIGDVVTLIEWLLDNGVGIWHMDCILVMLILLSN